MTGKVINKVSSKVSKNVLGETRAILLTIFILISLLSASSLFLGKTKAAQASTTSWPIQTVVGGGVISGQATTIGQIPFDVAYFNGIIYATSSNNCDVFAISTTNGYESTVAGNDACGYTGDNGPATSAEIGNPQGVAVDSSGNLLIADTGYGVIRLVINSNCSSNCPYGLSSTVKGDIYTVAGNGTVGYSGDNGPANLAELSNPGGVVVDSSGNLVIVDTANNMIREVTLNPFISLVSPNTGPITGGTSVTITGSNFTNVSAVNFGLVPASNFIVTSSTSITAVSPGVSSASLVDVSVSINSITSTITSNDQFTYLQNTYVPITSIRICDTRVNNSTTTGIVNNQCNGSGTSAGTLGSNSPIDVKVTGIFNPTNSSSTSTVTIPSNATAVVANITATNTTSNGGYLIAFPTGNSQPNASIVNFNANDSVSNLVQVGVGTNGVITVYNFNGKTDVIVDLQGYFIPTSPGLTTGQYIPISPVRVCDTRTATASTVQNQCDTVPNTTLSQGQTINVNIAGSGGTLDNIPASATAVVLNVTATNTTSNGGFLTVYPSNVTTTPDASNLNFNAGQSVANRVIVPIDPTTGDITIYNFAGKTDVIVDVNGYYLGSNSNTTGSSFIPISPVRVCDTRTATASTVQNQCDTSPNTTLSPGYTMRVNVAGSGSGGMLDNIPASATAVVLNVTATNTTSNGGYFTIYPSLSSTTSPPNISDLNWSQNETRANMVVVNIGANDSINVYNALGSADLIVDVMGYYS